jgi:CubicO group peptidase (beta-lactamase class C family)
MLSWSFVLLCAFCATAVADFEIIRGANHNDERNINDDNNNDDDDNNNMKRNFKRTTVAVPPGAKYDFRQVQFALDNGIAQGAYPGYAFALVTAQSVLFRQTGGNYTYGIAPPANGGANPPVTSATLFDMASLTKVTATTSAVARLYQTGLLALETRVGAIIGAQFDVNGKAGIVVRNLLLHNAGFAPDPNPFWNMPSFGCPQTARYHPQLDFSCMGLIYDSIMNQSLVNPIGSKYVYSDLSFMTLALVVGHVARANSLVAPSELLPSCGSASGANREPTLLHCYYEAYLRTVVLPALGMQTAQFVPAPADAPRCAPTTNETSTYRHECVQGVVQVLS